MTISSVKTGYMVCWRYIHDYNNEYEPDFFFFTLEEAEKYMYDQLARYKDTAHCIKEVDYLAKPVPNPNY